MRKVLLSALVAVASVQALSTDQDYWQSYLEVAGQTTTWHKGAGVYLFLPIFQDPCGLIFSQMKGGHFIDSWIGSVGAGYRQLQSRNFAWGVNAFFDISRSDQHLTHVQGSIGGELFGPCWEARINGYFPSLRSKVVRREQASELVMEGPTVFRVDFTRQIQEAGYRGLDAEAGYGFDVCHGSLWGYAGYYYFTTNKQKSFDGPRIRAEYRLDNVLGWCGVQALVGVMWEYDNLHGNKTSLTLGFRVPLGCPARSDCASPSSICRRMGNRVRRMESIVIAEQEKQLNKTSTPVMTPAGKAQNIFFVGRDDLSLLEIANEHDYIVLVGDNGPIDGSITLKDHQRLLGFGDSETLAIHLPEGKLNFTNEHGRATLTGDGDLIRLANHNTVSNIFLKGGAGAIIGNDPEGTRLSNLTIRGTKGDAIHMPGAHNTTFDNVALMDIDGRGIFLNTNRTTMRNVIVTRTKKAGISLANATDISLSGVRIHESGEEGLLIQKGGRISLGDLQITGSGKTALKIIDVDGIEGGDIILGSRGDGLHIEECLGPIQLGKIQVSAQERGVVLDRNGATVTIDAFNVVSRDTSLVAHHQNGLLTAHKGTLVSTDGAALDLDQANVDLSAIHLSSRNSKTHGIAIKNTAGKLDIRNASIMGAKGDAIHITGGAPLVSYSGEIFNTHNHLLFVDGVRGGSINLDGIYTGLNDHSGKGIAINDSNCEVLINGAHLQNTQSDAAIKRTKHTGRFAIKNSTITGHQDLNWGILAQDAGSMLIKHCSFKKVAYAMEFSNITGTMLVQHNEIKNLNGYGTACKYTGSGTATLNFSDNRCSGAKPNQEISLYNGLEVHVADQSTLHLVAARNTFSTIKNHAIVVTQAGSKGDALVELLGNTVTHVNGSPAFYLTTDASCDDNHFNFRINNNNISQTEASAIVVDASSSGKGKTQVSGQVLQNTFDRIGKNSHHGTVVLFDNLKATSDQMTVCIEENHSLTNPSSIAIAASASEVSRGEFNVTIRNNHDDKLRAALPAYQVGNSGHGKLHLTLENNTSDRIPPTILLHNKDSGRFLVHDLQHLNANNANIGVYQSGNIEDAPSYAPLPEKKFLPQY